MVVVFIMILAASYIYVGTVTDRSEQLYYRVGYRHLSFLSSQLCRKLLSPSLSLLSSQFPENVNSPAEGVVIARVAIEFVQGLEFGVGDDEVYYR